MATLALLTIACIVQLAFAFTIKKVTIGSVEYSEFIPESTEENLFQYNLFLPTTPPYQFLKLSLKAGYTHIGAVPVRVFGTTGGGALWKVTSVTTTGVFHNYSPTAAVPELLQYLKEHEKVMPILDTFAFNEPNIATKEPGHCYMNAAIVVAENVVGISKEKWNGIRWNKDTWEAMANQLKTVTKQKYYGDGWSREFVQLMLRTKGLNFGLNPEPKSKLTPEYRYEFQRNNFLKKSGTGLTARGYDFKSLEYYTELLQKTVKFKTESGTTAPMEAMILTVSTIPDLTKKEAKKKEYSWPKVNHATVMLPYDHHWWYIDTNHQFILPLSGGKPMKAYITGERTIKGFEKKLDSKYLVEQSSALGGDVNIAAEWLHSKCEVQTVHGQCGSFYYYVVVKDPTSKIGNWDEYVKLQTSVDSVQPYLPRDSPWNVAAPFIMLFGTIEVLMFCTCCVVGAVVGYLIHFVKEKYVFSK